MRPTRIKEVYRAGEKARMEKKEREKKDRKVRRLARGN
jgi:hypothetical protein